MYVYQFFFVALLLGLVWTVHHILSLFQDGVFFFVGYIPSGQAIKSVVALVILASEFGRVSGILLSPPLVELPYRWVYWGFENMYLGYFWNEVFRYGNAQAHQKAYQKLQKLLSSLNK